MRSLRIPLALAFCVAALLSLVNVSAYSTATVGNSASVTVSTTDQATLALYAAPTSNLAVLQNGTIYINFEAGTGVTPGLRIRTTGPIVAADDFTFMNVFSVINKSTANDVCVNIATTGAWPPALSGIVGRSGSGSQTWVSGSSSSTKLFVAKNNTTMNVDFHFNGGTSTLGAGTFQLTLSATKTTSGSCP